MEMIEAQLALYFGDVANGNYENAYARLDWIKSVKPNFPGIDDMISEIIPKLSFVPTQSSPTITDGGKHNRQQNLAKSLHLNPHSILPRQKHFMALFNKPLPTKTGILLSKRF